MAFQVRLSQGGSAGVSTAELKCNIASAEWKDFIEAIKRDYLGDSHAVVSHLMLIDGDGDEASGQIRDIVKFKKFLQTKCVDPDMYFMVVLDERDEMVVESARHVKSPVKGHDSALPGSIRDSDYSAEAFNSRSDTETSRSGAPSSSSVLRPKVVLKFLLFGVDGPQFVGLSSGASWSDIEDKLRDEFELPPSFMLRWMNLIDSNDEDTFSIIENEQRFWKAVHLRYLTEPGMYFLVNKADDIKYAVGISGGPLKTVRAMISGQNSCDSPSDKLHSNGMFSPISPDKIDSPEVILKSNTNIDSALKTVECNSDAIDKPFEPADGNRFIDSPPGKDTKQSRKIVGSTITVLAKQSENDTTPAHSVIGGLKKNHNFGDLPSATINRNEFVKKTEEKGVQDFLRACGDGDMPKLMSLMRSLNLQVTVQDSEGLTALHVAALRGQLEVSYFLLSSANPSEHSTISNAQRTDCTSELCSMRDNYMLTPLHYACENEHLHVAEMLIKWGADVCARNANGATPLHIICLRRAKKLLGLIKPIYVNTATDSGLTLLHCAADQGHLDICTALVHMPGILVNARDDMGLTPLHYACISGFTGVGELLVNHGAYVNPRDDDGMTPLLHAAQRGHIKTVLWLLSVGGNLFARDNWGCTAVHLAAEAGCLPMIKLLYERKMDLNCRNVDGLTPLELASLADQDQTATWLEDHGAWVRPETETQADLRRQIDATAEAATRAFEAEEEANIISGFTTCNCLNITENGQQSNTLAASISADISTQKKTSRRGIFQFS